MLLLCTAGFSSTWTFCNTDFVLLAGFVLSVRWINDFGNMAVDGAALVEVRLAISLVSSSLSRGMLQKRWWMFHRRVSCP